MKFVYKRILCLVLITLLTLSDMHNLSSTNKIHSALKRKNKTIKYNTRLIKMNKSIDKLGHKLIVMIISAFSTIFVNKQFNSAITKLNSASQIINYQKASSIGFTKLLDFVTKDEKGETKEGCEAFSEDDKLFKAYDDKFIKKEDNNDSVQLEKFITLQSVNGEDDDACKKKQKSINFITNKLNSVIEVTEVLKDAIYNLVHYDEIRQEKIDNYEHSFWDLFYGVRTEKIAAPIVNSQLFYQNFGSLSKIDSLLCEICNSKEDTLPYIECNNDAIKKLNDYVKEGVEFNVDPGYDDDDGVTYTLKMTRSLKKMVGKLNAKLTENRASYDHSLCKEVKKEISEVKDKTKLPRTVRGNLTAGFELIKDFFFKCSKFSIFSSFYKKIDGKKLVEMTVEFIINSVFKLSHLLLTGAFLIKSIAEASIEYYQNGSSFGFFSKMGLVIGNSIKMIIKIVKLNAGMRRKNKLRK